MIDPEPAARFYIPRYFDTKEPFNQDLVKDAIGKQQVIIYPSGSTKVGGPEQQHDHPAFRTGFICFPVLQDKLKEIHNCSVMENYDAYACSKISVFLFHLSSSVK